MLGSAKVDKFLQLPNLFESYFKKTKKTAMIRHPKAAM
jgi:hypothetical protein